jgi:hypothetical protein
VLAALERIERGETGSAGSDTSDAAHDPEVDPARQPPELLSGGGTGPIVRE